jgi:predicted outer membrane repeat protein
MPDVIVTFTAPASGASGTFASGGNVTTATTDVNGLAVSPAFTANALTGSYVVSAAADGIAAPAQFQLENYISIPTTISIVSGTQQFTVINTVFGLPLSVLVKDQFSQPMQGADVTFTAPASAASGAFAGGTYAITVTTNSGGIAVSPIFTANNLAGTYMVAATIALPASISFQMTNKGIQYVSPNGVNGSVCNNPVAPCQTINYAISKAATGDVVYVTSGTHNQGRSMYALVYIYKDVTLSGGWNNTFTSQNGVSILDGQNGGPVIRIGEQAHSSIERFEIINGSAENGGGVYIYGAAYVALKQVSIHDNTAQYSALWNNYGEGGGIWVNSGTELLIENSTIANNTAYKGGAIYVGPDVS